MQIKRRPTSVQDLIRHSLKLIEGDIQRKHIALDVSRSSDVPEIMIDPDRFKQVLLNLYLNSIEAMEDGGTLSVKVRNDKDLDSVEITISDTGRGIREEDLAHIFDPYFTTKSSGTGLGLAVVHKIIESHNGKIRVESQPGIGTTVTILLPYSFEG
jgi:two-component system sensor histidine kinase HydH